MPRVSVPVTSITRTGVADATPITGDPVNNHEIANSGDVWIEVANTGVSSGTVSAHFPNTVDGVTVDPKTWTVPAGENRRIGPFPTRLYGTTLQIDVDSVDLDLTAYRVPVQA